MGKILFFIAVFLVLVLPKVGIGHLQKNRAWAGGTGNAPAVRQLLALAATQVGVKEASGNNDGSQVERYLAYTGNAKSEPWCAAFVSWVFGKAGYAAPRTAWSPALFPKTKRLQAAQAGAVFGIYFSNKQRIAHVGFVSEIQGNWVYTIEGNTNPEGLREGDGVYRRLRHAKTIAAYANWLPAEKGATHEY